VRNPLRNTTSKKKAERSHTENKERGGKGQKKLYNFFENPVSQCEKKKKERK